MDKPKELPLLDDDLLSRLQSTVGPEVLNIILDRTKAMGGNPAYAVMLLPDIISLVLCACIDNRAHEASLKVLYALTERRLRQMSIAQEVLEAMDKIIDKDGDLT